jgi:hypothetical protein
MNEDRHDESSRPSEWKVPGDKQLETTAYHVWKPRPLLRSVHWKPQPALPKDAAAGSYDVFVDQRVFKAIHQQLWNAGPGDEPFGFLVGDLCEDPDTGRRYVIVSAAVPSRFPLVEEEPEQIPGEAMVAMQLEVDRRRGVLAGWYHRHRSGAVELTAEDVRTHEKYFPEPWQVALLFVTDFADPTGGCFRRAHDGLVADTPLPFFEMVSNESLLARGVRRSHVDWVNVETVDSIEADLPFRSEPPAQPESELPAEPEPESESEPRTELESESAVELEPALDQPESGQDDESEVSLPALPFEVEESPEVGPVVLDEDPEPPLEAGSSALAPEGLLAELDAVEAEFSLPVLDEFAAGDSEREEVVDLLPEPGWDSGDLADELSLPVVDDVDLDSFVTEVETADVSTQVDEASPLEVVEPDWDAATSDGRPDEDLLAVSLTEQEFEEGLATRLDEPSEPMTEPDLAAAPEEVRRPQSTARFRSPALLVGGLLVAAAIVVSLFVFVLPSGSEGEAGAMAETVSTGGADAAQPQGGDPVEAVPSETGEPAGEQPIETLAAIDSLAAQISADDMEQLGDVLLESISRYYGRAVAVDGGQATCSDLQAVYVEVEDRWIAYNVQGRARFQGRLPDELATRDERLYAGVQDVEREFTRSGCERP